MRSYGTVLTRLVGCRPISCMPGVLQRSSSCARSAMKAETRNSSCVTKETARTMAVPARNPDVSRPRLWPLERQMRVATVKAAETTQSPIPDPNNNPVTLLEGSRLIDMKRNHDNRTSAAVSSKADIIEATLVDVVFV